MRSALSALALLLAFPLAAAAQGVRPGDERPELPAPGVPPPETLELPALEGEEPRGPEGLAGGLRVYVERYQIEGSTVFTPEELEAAVAPFRGREIASEELLAARDAVTRLYVERGYPTSGAVIPDQPVAEGVVRLQVIEGLLAEVEVKDNRWFRDRYFRSRLLAAGRAPLSLARLESALQRFQRDPWIARVAAELEPGPALGESRLVLRVEETLPFRVQLAGGNDHDVSVGEWGGDYQATFANALGFHDVWWSRGRFTEGMQDVEGHLAVPFTPWDTRFEFDFRDTQTKVVEDDFEDLDIKASQRTWGVAVAQPVWRTEDDEVELMLTAERRHAHGEVLGQCFAFPPATDCDGNLTALRIGVDWVHRTRSDVIAARSLLSVGLDVLGATESNVPGVPDGDYLAWLAQLQWAHVLPESLWSTWVVLRGDLQLADSPLLTLEKLSVGGMRSVRGYRENQLVRDAGVVVSGELRIPLWRDAFQRRLLELVPFTDVGYAWNVGPGPLRDGTLLGMGVGLRFSPFRWLFGEFYWGGRVLGVSDPGHFLQDDGIYLRLTVDVP